MEPEDGEALVGGGMNEVVRVGNTVRRSTGPWTATIHRLLKHIRANGFLLAPEPMGFDAQGREVLSWIPGQMADADFLQLEAVGALVRALHEATAGFDRTGAVWRWEGHGGDSVICHNDLSPWNFLVDGREITGIIDWDVASPGDPLSDFAMVLWRFAYLHPSVELRSEQRPLAVEERVERVRSLARGYDLAAADANGALARLQHVIVTLRDYIETQAASGDPLYVTILASGTSKSCDDSLAFIHSHRTALERALR